MALLNTEQVAVQYTAPPPLIRAQDAWHRCSLVLAAVLMLAVFTILTFAVLQPSSPANVFLAQKPLSRSSRPRSRQLIINANDGTQATAAAPGPAVAPQALPVVNDHVGNALVVAGVLGLVIVYILRKRSRGALHHEYALAGEGWFPEKLQPGAAPEQTEQRKKPQEVLPKAARSCSEGQIASRVPVAAPALALNVQSFAGPPRGALTAQSFAFNPLNRSFNSTLWRPNLSDPEEYVMDEASMNKMPTITTEDTHEDVWRALSVVSAFRCVWCTGRTSCGRRAARVCENGACTRMYSICGDLSKHACMGAHPSHAFAYITGGGSEAKKKPKIDLQLRVPLIKFFFFPEKKPSAVGGWVDQPKSRGGQFPPPPPWYH